MRTRWLPYAGVVGAAVALALILAPRGASAGSGSATGPGSAAGPGRAAGAGAAGPGTARQLAAGPPQAPPSTVAGPQSSGDPRAIFLRDCAVCHAADGTGTVHGPPLLGVGRAAIDYWVSTGRMPLLPADRPPKSRVEIPPPGQVLPNTFAPDRRRPPFYEPQVITALVDYVAGLTGAGPDIPQVNATGGNLGVGLGLFQEQCAACHAWGGDGGALLHVQAPSLHRSTPTQIAEAIRIGPGQMPAFGTAAISDQDLQSVVSYVTYLDHPRNRGGNPLWNLGPVAEGGVAWILGMVVLLVIVNWIGERG